MSGNLQRKCPSFTNVCLPVCFSACLSFFIKVSGISEHVHDCLPGNRSSCKTVPPTCPSVCAKVSSVPWHESVFFCRGKSVCFSVEISLDIVFLSAGKVSFPYNCLLVCLSICRDQWSFWTYILPSSKKKLSFLHDSLSACLYPCLSKEVCGLSLHESVFQWGKCPSCITVCPPGCISVFHDKSF